MNLDGKIALVTGASRGIGAAIADTLAKAGAIVVGTATSEGQAQLITERLSEWGGIGLVLNVGQDSSVAQVIKEIQLKYGTITILVNNAGITKDNILMRMKDEEWNEVINVNLNSLYRTSKAVIRGMLKAKQGRIINISSVIGLTGNAGQTNYAASKAGMIGFTKSLALEVGSRNITVNCVAPGFIQTDMTEALPEEIIQGLLQNIALAKLGIPQDIADTVLFLASDRANYISGQTIHVNGGMFMG